MSPNIEYMSDSPPRRATQPGKKQCRLCIYEDCDVDIVNCGCSFHVRCLPTKIFRGSTVQYQQGNQPLKQVPCCPSCMQPIKEMYLYPLSMDYLDQASNHNKNSINGTKKNRFVPPKPNPASNTVGSDTSQNPSSGQVRKRSYSFSHNERQDPDSESAATIAATTAPYIVWSKTTIECSDSDKLHFRTGRWNSAETDYVDFLTSQFDRSVLNLPHGIKLNEFLRDMLMCKSSRLTKKFKNAKLSTKLYQTTINDSGGDDPQSAAEFSRLQHTFLNTLSDVTRLILKFNMNRMWRQHLFNTCLQSGYENLLTNEWLKSLDEFEKKVTDSEESLKRVRRRRMETAFREDSKSMKSVRGTGIDLNIASGSKGYIAATLSSKREKTKTDPVALKVASSMFEIPVLPIMSTQTIASSTPDPTPVEQLKIKATEPNASLLVPTEILSPITNSASDYDDDFSFDFFDLEGINENRDMSLHGSNGESEDTEDSMAPFLSKLMSFVQKQDFPFHSIDVWVPGGISHEQCVGIGIRNGIPLAKRKLQIVHGGSATRSDLLPLTKLQLNEFGVYSRNFMFDGGAGMPGRVYTSSRYSWEAKIQEAGPEHFKRVAGAKMCNIRTAVGIPLRFSNESLVVVGLYSLFDLQEDPILVNNLTSQCQQLVHRPKISLRKIIPSSVDTMISKVVSKASLEDAQDCTESIFSHASDLTSANSTTRRVEELSAREINGLANLLAAHMPISQGPSQDTGGVSFLDKFISLRLVLLRYPSGCTEDQKHRLLILKRSYDGYVKVMMNKNDIAHMLVKDWGHLNERAPQPASVPWGPSIAHVDYSMSESANTTPASHPASHMAGPALPSLSMLLPPPIVPSSQGFLHVQNTMGMFTMGNSQPQGNNEEKNSVPRSI